MNSNSSPIFTCTDSLSRMAKPQPPWKPSNICCLRSEGFLLFTGYCLPSLFNNCLMRQSPLCPGERQPSTLVLREQCTISLGTDYRVGFNDKGSALCRYLNSTTCGNLLQTLLNSRLKLCLTHRPEGWCTLRQEYKDKADCPPSPDLSELSVQRETVHPPAAEACYHNRGEHSCLLFAVHTRTQAAGGQLWGTLRDREERRCFCSVPGQDAEVKEAILGVLSGCFCSFLG